jgi:hypothetical protein
MGDSRRRFWLRHSEEVSPSEWGQLIAAATATLTGLFIGLKWLVRGWLNELRPNSGSSLKDQVTRLETRVDKIYELLTK